MRRLHSPRRDVVIDHDPELLGDVFAWNKLFTTEFWRGAGLSWPRRGETDRRPLQRAAGAYVVLVDGVATLYLERGGATLQTLPAADDPAMAVTAARAFRALVTD